MTITPTRAALLGAALMMGAPLDAQVPEHEWAAARYEVTLLDDGSDAWHNASIEIGARRFRLTPIARVNLASRDGARAAQFEGDAYPAWPGVGYAYLSAAWSPEGRPFPDSRLAGEFFLVLPAAFEVSAGFIRLDYPGATVPIWLGSVGKYIGNYWLTARQYWLPEQDAFSFALAGRRYFRAGDEFVTARLIRGSAPETLLTEEDIGRLESYTALVDGQLRLNRRWLALPTASITSEELSGDRARTRGTLGFGLMYRF